MFHDFFAGSDLLHWPLVALGIFFTVFVAVVIRVLVGFRKGSRMDHVASLPLEDDAPPPARYGEGRV
jgi:hypothetical protein